MGGHDRLEGGAGYDEMGFPGVPDLGAEVDLGAGRASHGPDTYALVGIEGAFGTEQADVLAGSGAANRLVGSLGDDMIQGREGDDTLDGHDGTDTLDGGEGTDRCVSGETLVSCEA
jgi:Ca2+-binding RTX toxin-like protein